MLFPCRSSLKYALSNVVVVESRVVPALLTLLCAGHTLRRLLAKDGCSDGSTSSVALKLWILF
jgi:hypothetical protein